MSEDSKQVRRPKRRRTNELDTFFHSVENIFRYPKNTADIETTFQEMGSAINHIGNAIIAMGSGPPGIVGSGGGIARSGGGISRSLLIEFQVDDSTITAKGSNGNLFLDGMLDGKKVSVKRLAISHADIDQDILTSIKALGHANIVKFHGLMLKQNYIYLALEHRVCSLHDLIQAYLDLSAFPHDPPLSAEYKLKLSYCHRKVIPRLDLWTNDGYPTRVLKKLMRGVVSGLVELHRRGFTHADLKPQNVMLNFKKKEAKLSDVGIKKYPRCDGSSNPGTGWQPHEQIGQVGPHAKQVDLFSLGCLLCYCIRRGDHPFGGIFERDVQIRKNRVDLSLLQPEAHDLISQLLNRDPQLRPGAKLVLSHTFFWKSRKRLQFLCEFSSCIQMHFKKNTNPNLLRELESKQQLIFGQDWFSKLDPILKADITSSPKYRYEYHLVRDLLRVIRNKWIHNNELPQKFLELLSKPFHLEPTLRDGFDHYISKTFPRLFMECYSVACQFCSQDRWFRELDN